MDLTNSSTVDPRVMTYFLEKSFAFWDTADVIRYEFNRYAKWVMLMILKAWIDNT
jgi:lysine/ornithine N-monooxygenase